MTSHVSHPARRKSRSAIAVVVIGLVVVAAAIVGFAMLAQGKTSSSTAPTEERLHVVDLMDKANCVGKLVPTQSHSYETGECQLAGARVIIAVFETGEDRDLWLTTARQFMETFVAGVGWAAAMDKPSAAPLLAVALGGGVV
jgi:hypothetical protein